MCQMSTLPSLPTATPTRLLVSSVHDKSVGVHFGGEGGDTIMSEPVKTTYEHIVLDARGQAVISDTGMKVKQLVVEHLNWGWSPEELHFQHPHLTLGEVYSALAYYWDHRAEIDQAIEDDARYVQQLRDSTPDSPFVTRMRRDS
jgi:uncharacterized protein (DUF433 family)